MPEFDLVKNQTAQRNGTAYESNFIGSQREIMLKRNILKYALAYLPDTDLVVGSFIDALTAIRI